MPNTAPTALETEAEGVRRLYIDGLVRQVWLRDDVGGACLLMEVRDLDQVRGALGNLPLFVAGTQEIASLVPLRAYRGFAPRMPSRLKHGH